MGRYYQLDSAYDFYRCLRMLLENLADYRKYTLHSYKAGQPDGYRNPFYRGEYGHSEREYQDKAKAAFEWVERWFEQANRRYRSRYGYEMNLDLKHFVSTLTIDGTNTKWATSSKTGKNALDWFRDLLKKGDPSGELLDPIELRQRFYRGNDPIDWSKCQLFADEPKAKSDPEPKATPPAPDSKSPASAAPADDAGSGEQLELNLFDWVNAGPTNIK